MAVGCLGEKGVTLNPRERQQLVTVTAAHGNVPLSMQTPSQKEQGQAPHVPDTSLVPRPTTTRSQR